jgi:glycosyltransferase involved in cell wall biosynthesis
VERRVRESADVICVHGPQLVELVHRQSWYRAQPVVSIPMGAHGHVVSSAPLPESPTVLFFGRLEHYKGLDVFVAAVERASERVPGLRAIIAGQGEAADGVRSQVTKPEMFDWRIGFVRDEDISRLFAESSVVVLPYREASQSGVVPLAFANGRTVIATRVGGLPEAVDQGINGLLVDTEDPVQVADAIVKVLSDRTLLEELTVGASKSLLTGARSAEAVARAHLAVYETAISNRRPR